MTAVRPSLLLDFANTRALDPRITFTRASTATYYDGKTWAKAEENLLLRSQDYSASWVATNLTPVTGKTAPDSTSTATEFTASAANGTLTQSVTALAGDYTFSVWLRRVTGTGDVEISAHSGGTWVTQTLTSTWTRFTVTQTLTAGARTPGIRVVTSGDAIEVWGAQMELRSAVTAYTPTTTQPVTNYIPALQTAASGVARFDHDPVTVESLGLLIEEQRTNLFLRSEEFQTTWSATRANIDANIVVAPDGTLTGDKLVENTDLNTHILAQSVAVTNGTSYTFSVYAKASERPRIQLRAAYTSNIAVTFDLIAGTYIVVSGLPAASSITSVGNGWYRCAITGAAPSTSTFQFQIRIDDGATQSYQGDGYSGIYIWGAQLEAGAFPTSYIKTEASQVTRSADAASMTGTNFSSWYRQDEGTLYAAGKTVDSLAGFVGVDNGTTQNRIRIYQNTASTIRSDLFYNGASVLTGGGGSPLLGQLNKTATAYETGALASSTNGATVTSVAATLVPFVTQLRIGNVDGTSYLNGSVNKIAFYPKRLTNAQLQALAR